MPTSEQIDAILPFLSSFEAEGFSAGAWQSPPGIWPWFKFNEPVRKFFQALQEGGWVIPSFRRTGWLDTAREYVDSPERVESADAETIQRLFTTHLRVERFCDGHLAAMFENGHFVVLLRRLREIRRTMDS